MRLAFQLFSVLKLVPCCIDFRCLGISGEFTERVLHGDRHVSDRLAHHEPRHKQVSLLVIIQLRLTQMQYIPSCAPLLSQSNPSFNLPCHIISAKSLLG